MQLHWTCPRGHHGEAAADAALPACPVCGAALSLPPLQGTLLTQMQSAAASDLPTTQPSEAAVWAEGGERPRVPGYELLGELGRGGMGVVYKALQLRLNRVVALKMVLVGAHAGPEELQRFRLEAEAIAQLQHPHFVQIHDVGEAEGLPYLSLEFIEGGTLAEQLLHGRPTADEAARLVATLARAMHTAHQRGIIHRDLKPGNVLLALSDAVPNALRRNASAQPRLTSVSPRSATSASPSATPTVPARPPARPSWAPPATWPPSRPPASVRTSAPPRTSTPWGRSSTSASPDDRRLPPRRLWTRCCN